MRVLDIITAKRDGHRLTDEQIDWFISTYAAGTEIADEQAAALAMAIFFTGMEPDELAYWTAAMIDSGERLDLGGLDRPTVDKHSTGGVGDKISLILVPLVAACGAAVPQLSGRGLGHTGGTLDKMEAISGWQAQMSLDAMRRQLDTIGGVIAGASGDLAPADRKLYALRDVTGTVESIPLIASSIMSKKIAEGTSALTLDVKTGSGAFMAEFERADALARTMVDLGNKHGVATTALVTRMDTVLGRTAGNALEVQESLDVLAGGGPADVVELTVALAEEMVGLVGLDADPRAVLASGEALATFEAMVAAQGGDLGAGLPVAQHRHMVAAPVAGTVAGIDARRVGVAAWRLGAGRARKEDSVSATAGVVCLVGPGDEVEVGQPIMELHTDDPARFDDAIPVLADALLPSTGPAPTPSVVIERVGAQPRG
ncbi:MAG: thymidine phosphorylase [Actinomycetia bacterium]|nr:thymidine phosphorylase [Actinomycetes bacterium]